MCFPQGPQRSDAAESAYWISIGYVDYIEVFYNQMVPFYRIIMVIFVIPLVDPD